MTGTEITRRQCIISAFGLSFTACSEKPPTQANLPKIAAEAGVKFPAAAQLVVDLPSQKDKSGLWIIRSEEERFVLPGQKESTDSSEVRVEMDQHVKPDVLGELEDGIATGYSWNHDNLRYRGIVIRTSKGFFLRLERFAQP